MNHLSSSFPDSKGARLHYQYWEDSSKGYDRVALLLHGLGYHSGSYGALVPALVAARYKVVALDFAGFGASPGKRGSGGTLAMADAVEAIYRRIEWAEGGREIEVIAHSMGAVAALLFLKRFPARSISLAIVSPLFFGIPVEATPEVLFGDEALRNSLSGDPLYAPSISDALAADLEKTAKELLADPAFLEGRKAAFFVGEDDPLVPMERLRDSIGKLPLESSRFSSFPHERHDPLGGDGRGRVIAAIMSWFDDNRFEHRS